MYTVLIAVDEEEDRAHQCAKMVSEMPGQDELEVVLLHVFTDNPSGASAPQVGSVHEATHYLESHGIDPEIQESSGDPADEILDVAAELNADLICLAGRHRSPAGKAIFGSVTQAVILDSDRPVVVAPPASE